MNTLGQRLSASQAVKSGPVEGYIPLEPSFWRRHADIVWTMIIFLFIAIGLAVLILPAFVTAC